MRTPRRGLRVERARTSSRSWDKSCRALRAHDARIEDRLQHLLKIYEPSGNGRAEKTGYHLLTTSEPEGVKTYVVIGRDGVIENALAEADRKTTVVQLLERSADKVTDVTKTEREESLPEKPRSTWVADCRRRSKPKIAPVDVSAAQDRRESDDRYPVAPISEAQRTLLSGAIVDKRKGPQPEHGVPARAGASATRETRRENAGQLRPARMHPRKQSARPVDPDADPAEQRAQDGV